MNPLSRSTALKLAAIISFSIGIYAFFMAMPFLARGVAAINMAADSPPYFVIMAGFIFAFMRIFSAFGLWQNQRWGIIVTILANALDTLAAAPGILFAPTTNLWVSAITIVALGVIVIVLCLWREGKTAPNHKEYNSY